MSVWLSNSVQYGAIPECSLLCFREILEQRFLKDSEFYGAALEAELTRHLGHEHGQTPIAANMRNGTRPKTVVTGIGPVEIAVHFEEVYGARVWQGHHQPDHGKGRRWAG